MNNLSLESLSLTEITNAECVEIVGGSTPPSFKTLMVAAAVNTVFGPIGGMAFWAGYIVNS